MSIQTTNAVPENHPEEVPANRYTTRLEHHRRDLGWAASKTGRMVHPLSSKERYEAAEKTFRRKVNRLTYAFSFTGTAFVGAIFAFSGGSLAPTDLVGAMVGAVVGAVGYRILVDEDAVMSQVDPISGKRYLVWMPWKLVRAKNTFDLCEPEFMALNPSSETFEAIAALRSDLDAAVLVAVTAFETHDRDHESVLEATDRVVELTAQLCALRDIEKERAKSFENARLELPALTSTSVLARAIEVTEETTSEVQAVLARGALS